MPGREIQNCPHRFKQFGMSRPIEDLLRSRTNLHAWPTWRGRVVTPMDNEHPAARSHRPGGLGQQTHWLLAVQDVEQETSIARFGLATEAVYITSRKWQSTLRKPSAVARWRVRSTIAGSMSTVSIMPEMRRATGNVNVP